MRSSLKIQSNAPGVNETNFCGAISLVRERPAVKSRSPRKGKRERNHGFGLGHPCRKLGNMAQQHEKTRSRSRLNPHRTSPPLTLFRTTGVQMQRKPKRRSQFYSGGLAPNCYPPQSTNCGRPTRSRSCCPSTGGRSRRLYRRCLPGRWRNRSRRRQWPRTYV